MSNSSHIELVTVNDYGFGYNNKLFDHNQLKLLQVSPNGDGIFLNSVSNAISNAISNIILPTGQANSIPIFTGIGNSPALIDSGITITDSGIYNILESDNDNIGILGNSFICQTSNNIVLLSNILSLQTTDIINIGSISSNNIINMDYDGVSLLSNYGNTGINIKSNTVSIISGNSSIYSLPRTAGSNNQVLMITDDSSSPVITNFSSVLTTVNDGFIYVNQTLGSNTNNGCLSSPFSTIQQAINTAQSLSPKPNIVITDSATYNENIIISSGISIYGHTASIQVTSGNAVVFNLSSGSHKPNVFFKNIYCNSYSDYAFFCTSSGYPSITTYGEINGSVYSQGGIMSFVYCNALYCNTIGGSGGSISGYFNTILYGSYNLSGTTLSLNSLVSGSLYSVFDPNPVPNYNNNAFLYSSVKNPNTNSNIFYIDVSATSAQLASSGEKILYTISSTSKTYKIRSLMISPTTNFSGGGGNRDLSIVDDSGHTFSVIASATLLSLISANWGSTALPFSSDSPKTLITTNLFVLYSGGTNDYSAGEIVFSVGLERIS